MEQKEGRVNWNNGLYKDGIEGGLIEKKENYKIKERRNRERYIFYLKHLSRLRLKNSTFRHAFFACFIMMLSNENKKIVYGKTFFS